MNIILIKKHMIDSSVWIVVEGTGKNGETVYGSSSGVIIDKRGFVLVSRHSVREDRLGKIKNIFIKHKNSIYPTKVIKKDFSMDSLEYDISLLKIDSTDTSFPSVSIGEVPLRGKIFYGGFPTAEDVNNLSKFFLPGITTPINIREADFESVPNRINQSDPEKHGLMLLNQNVDHGFSGGPVINNDGNLIALISFNSSWGNKPVTFVHLVKPISQQIVDQINLYKE